MKRILVPTDFSNQADNAVKVAADLAKKYDAEVHLLHMVELPMHQIIATSNYSELPEAVFFMKLAHKNFEESLEGKNYLDDLDVFEHIKFNDISVGVSEMCQENEFDLVVMGSHGTDGLKEMFIGSNTEKVVRTSKVPVLVIKNKHDSFEVNNFVFASDFKSDNKDTYIQAIKLAEFFDAKIHLLTVNTAGNFKTTIEAEEAMNNFVKGSGYTNHSLNIFNDVSIEEGILNFSKLINADLIGISNHGRQGIAHLFNGSISEDLVNHANRPVITFRI